MTSGQDSFHKQGYDIFMQSVSAELCKRNPGLAQN